VKLTRCLSAVAELLVALNVENVCAQEKLCRPVPQKFHD